MTLTAPLLGCASPAGAPAPPSPAPDGVTAVAILDADDLYGIPVRQVEEWFEGRGAGLQVIHGPDGGISVRIRGRGSIYGDNEPLYVVDGMPVTTVPGRGLAWLNPGDVQRIEILKDASATALYGMRGANGVVLITTRHGRRPPDST